MNKKNTAVQRRKKKSKEQRGRKRITKKKKKAAVEQRSTPCCEAGGLDEPASGRQSPASVDTRLSGKSKSNTHGTRPVR